MPLVWQVCSSGFSLWFIMQFGLARNQENPTTSPLSGMATFPHGRDDSIHLSFAPLSCLWGLSQLVWWSAFLLDLGLILYLPRPMSKQRPRANATPSWTVLYVGIAVAALTYPVVGIREIAYLALVIGFGLTFLLLSPIYRDLKQSPYPVICWAKKASICAPFSLLF